VGLTLTLAIVSLASIGRLSDRIRVLQVDAIPGQYASGEIHARAKQLQVKVNEELLDLLANNETEFARRQAESAATLKRLEERMREYERTITLEEDRRLFAELGAVLAHCVRSIESLRATMKTAGAEQALAQFRSETRPAFDALIGLAERVADWNQTHARKNAEEAAAAAKTARIWNWTVAVLSILLGSVLSLMLVRRLNALLRQLALDLEKGAGQVSSAAAQVSASSQSLAQGSSEQASALEQTSAAAEEIYSLSRKNSDNSRVAADVVTQSQEKFGQVNHTLADALGAMAEISAQSDRISKIIKTIDEIAFQTNILALNAAVEAARAGEAGMGFAVVADEVRNLAQRCAQAAKDTADLIEESVSKSQDGKLKVDLVATLIRDVIAEAAKVKTLVDEVRLGAEEQAKGIEQISKAIAQMQQVTQQTAASAEEGAAASEELHAQAQALSAIAEKLSAMVGQAGASSHRPAPEGANGTRRSSLRSSHAGLVSLQRAVGPTSRAIKQAETWPKHSEPAR
jgi:methyl-accepting chemotaxis protein/methyl-accepting chemotaxis protein-1 (serine sensor receptor)